ncbi:MAG TPA: PAS domain-containing sensor histidine kinase [Micropepsaceae bacterium]|nr:PAS domain-containing sensor histidine kinase [Micropepsaceae bacterium]
MSSAAIEQAGNTGEPGAGDRTPDRTSGSWLPAKLRWLLRPGLLVSLVCVAAAISGIITYSILSGMEDPGPSPEVFLTLLLVNLAFVLALAAVIAWQLVQLWIARRTGTAGARLHVRLVAMFAAVAIIPTIMVAAFAGITLNLGVEAWFSERVKTALTNSLTVAEAYVDEHRQNIRADALAMASDINRSALLSETDPQRFREYLAAQALFRSLTAAVIVDGNGNVIASAALSFVLTLEPPSFEAFERARSGAVAVLTDAGDDRVQALVRLDAYFDRFLLVVRYVDARVLEHQRSVVDATSEYQRLEKNRSRFQLTFAAIYAVVGLLILLASIWLGLWAANRLVSPIGRLIGAAERVSEGDLGARVPMGDPGDEMGTLARAFNRMTAQLQSQRDELVESGRQQEVRRRFTEAVLAGVTAGVIGLDATGRINIINRSALTHLGGTREALTGRSIEEAVPEMAALAGAAFSDPQGRASGQIDLTRDGKTRNLIVRIGRETAEGLERGWVVTFDDITELVSAQRTSAWADVARRIAHEIKNPLTPIQLSAERLRRKYAREITTDPDVFEQCTATIIRQVGDIGRMVDEFSSFARMPAPIFREEDLAQLVRQTVFLQQVGATGIKFEISGADRPVLAACDGRQIAQALTNILKNAVESVTARLGGGEGKSFEGGLIGVALSHENGVIRIVVTDNGIGLPQEGRARLTEPYVTTRAKGTGLGLAIVRKIMEDHGGGIELADAPAGDARFAGGAMVTLSMSDTAASPRSDGAPGASASGQNESVRSVNPAEAAS